MREMLIPIGTLCLLGVGLAATLAAPAARDNKPCDQITAACRDAGFAPGASAAETGAPAPVVRVGSTEKVCQLTGETDWETRQPTAGRTLAVDPRLAGDLPEDQRRGIFIFGVPRYRAGVPYLAEAPSETLGNPATWRFFTRRAPNGQPKWVPHEEWMRGAAVPDARRPSEWKPPGEPEIFVPATNAGHCIGEFSITWNRPLGMWLMLYNCPREISARIAPAPWGPWSTPTEILGPGDGVACRLVMTPEGCGNRRDFWPNKHTNGKFVAGGFYAPYVLNRYTGAAAGNGPGRRSTIYWLVSSWNPYEVSVMRTTLQSDAF
jgi:hypothetical protein